MGVVQRWVLDKVLGKYRFPNRTGEINHVVDVKDDETIVGNRDNSYYGQ